MYKPLKMEEKDFLVLLQKIITGTANDEEVALYLKWYIDFENDHHDLKPDFETTQFKHKLFESIHNRVFQFKKPFTITKLWIRIAMAAAILMVFSIGLLMYSIRNHNGEQVIFKSSNIKKDILPGGNKAYLTLADGSKISLNDAPNGQLATQANIKISKSADGQIVYEIGNHNANASIISYNTIETPNGGQYQINLPDGTKVWLNANSSLRYPTVFVGNKRTVNLSGEAYFEVAKNAKMPFFVQSKYQGVEVLGTHFNINAYDDEPMVKTTLLEGSVKVAANHSNQYQLLKPNQQAQLDPKNNAISVADVNTEEAIAWKNGNFLFADEDLKSIMRKVGRWYDVEVDYQTKIDGSTFSGIVSRSKKVSQVIKIIEKTSNYKIKIEERRLIVMQ